MGSFIKLRRIVAKEGAVVDEPIVNKLGDIVGYKKKRHPADIAAKDWSLIFLRSGGAFGFDPSSRSKIKLPEGSGEPSDPSEDEGL
jgi:hypothetical protein